MAKYYIECDTIGFVDCDYRTEADTIEQVVEQCAVHGRARHNLRGFGPEDYAKMHPYIRLVENDQPLPAQP